MNTQNNFSTETLEDTQLLEKEVDVYKIIVFNDEVNTFDHVIDTLIKVCDHELEQAEQCTHIIHHNGKCSVKEGDIVTLKPLCEAILDRGISAQILD